MSNTSAQASASLPPPPRDLPRVLRRSLCLDDFEPAARRHLPRPIFGYVAGAAETNQTLEDNRRAFAEWGFLPKVLVDISKRTQSRTLFGQSWNTPFGIAPMGMAALIAYRGDLVLAQAAQEAGIPFIMSGSSLIKMEEVVAAAPSSWFQAYLPGDPPRINALISRVARAGFKTLVLTVDTAVLPSRENNVRNGFSTPLRPGLRLAWDGAIRPCWSIGTFLRTLQKHGMPYFENSFAERGAPIVARNIDRDFTKRDHLNWEHVRQIRKQWSGNLILKGVLNPGDAKLARENGIDGIIVSNHGGRQLDGSVSPIRVLPAVRAEAGNLPIMLDGGIRRGTDVMKALALGADFVFVGRPMIYAASVGGQQGVKHAIGLLSAEIGRDMALAGIADLDELSPASLHRLSGLPALGA